MGVLCAVFDCCHNAAGKDKNYSYFRIPKVVTSQGEKTKKLTKQRRARWLANISRADLTTKNVQHARVGSYHFIQGIII